MDLVALKKFAQERFWCKDALYDSAFFYEYEYSDESDDTYYKVLSKLVDSTWCEYGCTKLVMNFKEFPEVVFKIPFFGVRDVNDGSEIINETDYFGAVKRGLNKDAAWDYCSLEEELYNQAKEWGLDDIFTETAFLCCINGVNIYVSPLCEIDCFDCLYSEPYEENATPEQKETSKQLLSYMNDKSMTDSALLVLSAQYGEDAVCDFIDFINYYDIGDFHSANMGFTESGQFKIFDYGDFRS